MKKSPLISFALTLLFCARAFAGAAQDFASGQRALSEGDFLAAKKGFDSALAADPSLSLKIGDEWMKAAQKSVAGGDYIGAAGLYAWAGALDPKLAQKAGEELLAAADAMKDEEQRARVVHGAIGWVGAQRVADATARWRAKIWGEPTKVLLETDGWAVFGEVGVGDRLVYVAPAILTQRNGELIRLLPASADRTFELLFDSPRAPLKLKKKDEPQTAYIWVFPAR